MSTLMIHKAQEQQASLLNDESFSSSSSSFSFVSCCSPPPPLAPAITIASDNAKMMEHQRRKSTILLPASSATRQSIVDEAIELCQVFERNSNSGSDNDEAPRLPCRSPDGRSNRRKKVTASVKIPTATMKRSMESHRESRWEAATKGGKLYQKDSFSNNNACPPQCLLNNVPIKPRRSI